MPKKVFLVVLSFLLVLSIALMAGLQEGEENATTGSKHWLPGDGHKMHEAQLPDEAGWDVNATYPMILADDWMCSETGLVKDIHFWGSWMHGQEGIIDSFHLSIHADIPAQASPTGYSMPEEPPLWEWDTDDFEIVAVASELWEGWYDPETGEILPNDHNMYYQYNIFLPEDQWFFQEEGTIYWLNISAYVSDPVTTHWGWKSSFIHFMDDAVWYVDGSGMDWQELYEPAPPLTNNFGAVVNEAGTVIEGWGDYSFRNTWYYYENTDWWNIWFYDHPYDINRWKQIHIEFDVAPWEAGPSLVVLAINWSTDLWSLEGNPLPASRVPPIPPLTVQEEANYIGRYTLLSTEIAGPEHYIFDFDIPDYNPEWVSVDIMGNNYALGPENTFIAHYCLPKTGQGEQSLDLAFVITGEPELEACCLPDGSCSNETPANCVTMGGIPQGPGTSCTMAEACCLADGSCVMADPICCDDLGGTPQGPGTNCTVAEACCLAGGSCIMVDPICCDDMGGTPQGGGTACTQTEACCFTDGSCQNLDPLCCDDMGGTSSPTGAQACLGDNNGNNIDDACEESPYELKWEQPPDLEPTGMDVSDFWHPQYGPYLLADDFLCTTTGPIREIHIWGSWWQDELPNGDPNNVWFILSIHEDIPAIENPYGDYSMPGELLCLDTLPFTVTLYAEGLHEGWFEPPDHWDEYGDSKCWEYIFTFDEPECIQEGTPEDPVIYWLDLQAYSMDETAYFGWKTSTVHWNDDAAWIIGVEPLPVDPLPQWFELRYPTGHPWQGETVDLAFQIWGEELEMEACCFPDGSCTNEVPANCTQLGGTPQGPGTACGGVQACCLTDNTCRNVDSICCVNELGGTPQGAGTACGGMQACCLSTGACVNADSICCVNELGGTPQGAGTACTGTQACCFGDGSCDDLDPLCCDDMGGTPSPIGAQACLGDLNGDGTDDACQVLGACCLENGSCQLLEQADCEAITGAEYKGDGTICLGDLNGNGVDDACEEGWQPGDPHKMHEPQLPDEAGWDVNATFPMVLADDWKCSESGPVRDIHFWGSWKNGVEANISHFILSIHADVPADISPTGYSMPADPPLWEYDAADYLAVPIESELWEGWYDPNPDVNEVIPFDHNKYYQYNVYLPEPAWFEQEEGNIYWLNISAVVDDVVAKWGWKSSWYHWNDDAVWTNDIQELWYELYEPAVALRNDFFIFVDQAGNFVDGSGTYAYGDGWYFYENTEWWNIWFYDHPFDPARWKNVYIEFDLHEFEPGPIFIEFAVNWSTDLWSLEGNPLPNPRVPPIPPLTPEEEGNYIGRHTLLVGQEIQPGHYEFAFEFPDYNPEWVSIDVRGSNFAIPGGFIIHECAGDPQSLDLSFVITGFVCDCRVGDANEDLSINLGDAVYINNIVFHGGPMPTPYPICSGDANKDCSVNLGDAVYINNIVFHSGPMPPTCEEWIADPPAGCGPPLRK